MKLIHDKVIVDVGDGRHILINTLNGLIDLLDEKSYCTLLAWEGQNPITPITGEDELFDTLLANGYLVEDDVEEAERKEAVLAPLRRSHQQSKESFAKLVFVMTYNCNFRCTYCYEEGAVPHGKHLTNEMVDAAFALTDDKLTDIGLYGGEPLLPENRSVIEHILRKGIDKKFQITTNGYTLLEYFDLLKDLDLRYIQISLDGAEETHNKRRFLAGGAPTYQKIVEGIELYLAHGLPIRIRMTVDESNLKECEMQRSILIEKWKAYQENLTFELFPLLQFERDAKIKLTQELCDIDGDKNADEMARFNTALNTTRPIVNYFLCGKPPRPLYYFCQAHGDEIYVDPFGDIYSCVISLGNKDLSVGTYYPNKSMKEKSILTRNIETIPKCSKCNYALLCGGGCPLQLQGGYDDIMRPCCDMTRHEIHTLVPYLFLRRRTEKGHGSII